MVTGRSREGHKSAPWRGNPARVHDSKGSRHGSRRHAQALHTGNDRGGGWTGAGGADLGSRGSVGGGPRAPDRGLRAALAQTEDQGNAAFYRFLPRRRPRESGDLASFGGRLEALVVRGRPNFDANTAEPGQTFQVEWVKVEDPNPPAHGARGGAVEGRSHLRPHRGRGDGRRPDLLRLHDRRRGPVRPAVGVPAARPRRRRAEADLRVARAERARRPGQRRRGAAHGRRVAPGGRPAASSSSAA
jgi:hypothetical protein